MAVTAHLTLVAPNNEKFAVQSALARLPRRETQRRISIAGASNRARGRAAGRGHEGQPLGTP